MENNSLRGRFSLSTTNLTSPIAESTCLNGSSSHTKFNWGEGTMSSKNRNNSLAVNKSASMSKKVNSTPPKVTMSPASRIDPSNGLASRIVKYHDNSTRMNRSLSMGNLYNKPGQFPVVHLKKNEQQYKAKKSRNLSITRIAAPEKSVFHGNTLSSILRSGSIVGMQKSDEEISRENRPILHPPPTENEMAPTRSVLEVLKEISRKRIISDELDGTELIKKHCKEPDYDATPYNNIQKNQTKRQRELSTTSASNVQLSPEQVVKKRMCTYNNDILSSLSSSMMSMNKRKMINTQTQKRTASDLASSSNLSPGSKDTEPMRSEKQHRIAAFDLEQLAQTNKYTPITPLPNTPEQGSRIPNDYDKYRAGIVTRRASEPAIRSSKPKLTLFNKDYDEEAPPVRDEACDPAEGDLCGIQFVKPKKSSSVSSGGALLMEKTQKSKLALMLSGLKGELNEEDETDASQPKEQPKNDALGTLPVISVASTPATISFGTTTTAVTTESSRPVATPAQVSAKIDFAVPPTIASSGEDKKTTTSDVVTSTAPSSATVTLPAATPKVSIPATTPSIPTLTTFSFGLSKPTATTAAVATTTTPSTYSQSTLTQAATVVSSASATTLPALTLGTQPFSFGLATTQSPTASKSGAPTFTFGAPTTSLSNTQPPSFGNATTTTTAPKTDVPPPVFGQSSAATQPSFSFGSLAAQSKTETATTSLTTVTTTVATTSVPTFNFGAPKTDWNSSTNKPQNPSISKIEPIAFGNNATTSLNPPPIPALTSTPSTGGFAFGVSTANEAPKSLFTSTFPTTTAPSNLNTTFSFSANKEVTAAPNTFTFGAAAPQAAVATANAPAQPLMFGSNTPDKPSNSFAFAAAAPAAPVKAAFSFSAGDKPAVTTASNSIGGFSFNSATANSAPMQESNQNIFGAAVSTAKPAFNFGATPAAGTQSNDKPPVFGASTVKTTNLFGAPATTTVQSSTFTFGAPTTSSTNLFGGATAAAPNTNPTTDLSATSSSSGSIFGGPSAAAAPLQPSATFTFGSTSSNPIESNKPTGGFVFGSSSSIGSNASKPSADLNKTFVFGDGSTTTITPAPAPVTTNLFGGNNTAPTGTTDNKLFSFGGAPNAGSSTFGGSTPAPVFSFGATPPANPGQNTNSFAPTGGPPNPLAPTDRPIRKAMRRLHKT